MRVARVTLAIFSALSLGAASARAGSSALQAQCFTPTALAARPGEETPRKGDRRYDAAEPARALAPFQAIPRHLSGAIRRVDLPKGRKLIALTLDMCEQPGEVSGYDGRIIDYLRSAGIKATLFVGGKWMRSHAERTKQLLSDPLFEIANHSAGHRNLRLLSGEALRNEIAAPQRAYEALRDELAQQQCAMRAGEAASKALPQRMSLFRFPFGACNAPSLEAVNAQGLLAIQWDVSTGDPSPATSAREIVATMLRQIKPGSIIIAHANGRGYHTAEALPLAVPRLKAQGFEFVTVSALIAAGTPVVTPTCYDSRPGDTDKYDVLFARPRTSPHGGGAIPTIPPSVKSQAGRQP